MKLREIIKETTTAGAVAVGAVAVPKKGVIKRTQEDVSSNSLEGMKVWEVYIANNYSNGKHSRPYPVISKDEESAKRLVLDNAHDVLEDITSRKFASGAPILSEKDADEITEKNIEKIVSSESSHMRSTASPESILTPEGFKAVMLDSGVVSSVVDNITESIQRLDEVRVKSQRVNGRVHALLGESVVVKTKNNRMKVHMDDIETMNESVHLKLGDIAEIGTNFKDADFWIQRKGGEKDVGRPTMNFSPEHIGIKINKENIAVPKYIYYAIQYLHSKGYFEKLARGTTRLMNIRLDDIKNIKMSMRESVKEATRTKTKTKTDIDLDDILNPRTDTLPTVSDKTASPPEKVSVQKATAADTARAVSNITPTDQMRDLLGRMRDIEIDDDEDDVDVGYVEPVEVTTDNLPAVISKELKTDGVQSPKFHQVSILPGNMNRAIRQLGKKLFKAATRTPTEEIHMIGDLSGMGPNSHEEVNAVAGWVTQNGVAVTGLSEISFDGIFPGYTADYQMYTAGGVRWMLIQDYIDGNYMGKYIFMWPEQDSVDHWNKKNLDKDVDGLLESVTIHKKSLFGIALMGAPKFLSTQKVFEDCIPLPVKKLKNSNIKKVLESHIKNKIPLSENIFRLGSLSYVEVFAEARRLKESGNLPTLDPISEELLNGDAGLWGDYEGEDVPLDIPMIAEAEYKGRKVKLNKPKRGGNKAYYVYVKNPKTDNVIKVEFGSGSRAKIDDPKARKRYDSRHGCSKGRHNDKTKAGYWSCRLPRFAKALGLSGSGEWW